VVSTGGLYPPGEGLARAYSAAGKDLVVEAGLAGLQLTALSGGLSCLADQIDPDLGGRRASVGL